MARILVVEDDESLQDMLQLILSHMGYEVLGSLNGVDALYQAAYYKPDLIILDLMMPWASGDAVLGFIRSTAGLKSTRVLVLSAHPNAEKIAAQLQADRFLAKPVDLDRFRAVVGQLVPATDPTLDG
jgi:DNA-binding response OmpR family regulator